MARREQRKGREGEMPKEDAQDFYFFFYRECKVDFTSGEREKRDERCACTKKRRRRRRARRRLRSSCAKVTSSAKGGQAGKKVRIRRRSHL